MSMRHYRHRQMGGGKTEAVLDFPVSTVADEIIAQQVKSYASKDHRR